MKYLAYYEVIESSGWKLSDDLEGLKGEWCFAMRIFDVNNMTQEDLDNMPKPIYPEIKSIYELIHSDGSLIHEKE